MQGERPVVQRAKVGRSMEPVEAGQGLEGRAGGVGQESWAAVGRPVGLWCAFTAALP